MHFCYSNPNDRIFVYFTDHGAVGLIAFPDEMVNTCVCDPIVPLTSPSKEIAMLQLTVKQLNKTLSWMFVNKRYDQLVFYLESCESGSMFENVLDDTINGKQRISKNRKDFSGKNEDLF